MFGVDLRAPTDAAILPTEPIVPCNMEEYRKELIHSLSSAGEIAVSCMESEQKKSKIQLQCNPKEFKLGDWVFVDFPVEETGKKRKLSKPWHGPYRVIQKRGPNVTVVPVYFPESGEIQIHLTRVCPCPLH